MKDPADRMLSYLLTVNLSCKVLGKMSEKIKSWDLTELASRMTGFACLLRNILSMWQISI